MKLPDFFNFEPLNRLRKQMGIPDNEFSSLGIAIRQSQLSSGELSLLSSGEGIDVSFEDLTVLADGTLAYKDSRVLLYIRDVHVHGDKRNSEPRYHLSHCVTLHDMTQRGRFERYVIATEVTGEFKLNVITGGKPKSERRKLKVCQNCLSGLSFDGFSLQMTSRVRREIVGNFTPATFFARYPQSLHGMRPSHNADNAPLNNYTADWPSISEGVRRRAGWKCSSCRCDLSDKRLKQYLEVHHIDGRRQNNDFRNLRVLCVACHAEQPMHGHMKASPRYKTFLQESRHLTTCK